MEDSPRPIDPTICGVRVLANEVVRLGHGSGGRMSDQLISGIFLPRLGNDIINTLEDASVVSVDKARIAVTTDSYVVSPVIFPGGNIGSLAVHGTVNDLAMRGARPLYLTASFIIEEGLAFNELTAIVESMSQACNESDVKLIAADTKVVNKGAGDQIFINTTGIGVIEYDEVPSANRAVIGDYVVVSGDVGRHGAAILCAREQLGIETSIVSDSSSLYKSVAALLRDGLSDVHCLRDITRGGLATILNELCEASNVAIQIDEMKVPIHPEVSAICELLGLDPLYVACEGRFVSIVSERFAHKAIALLQQHSPEACIIGRIISGKKGCILNSRIGGRRILDKLQGDQLPRIC